MSVVRILLSLHDQTHQLLPGKYEINQMSQKRFKSRKRSLKGYLTSSTSPGPTADDAVGWGLGCTRICRAYSMVATKTVVVI